MTEDDYERDKRFKATELGATWWKYHNAMINYWSESENHGASLAEMSHLRVLLVEASEPFRAKLMELAGVQ
jgi:hypothetical protein